MLFITYTEDLPHDVLIENMRIDDLYFLTKHVPERIIKQLMILITSS